MESGQQVQPAGGVQQVQPAGGVQQQERLNQAVQQQLNLEQVKSRAISLFKAISRMLEDLDAYSRTHTLPKWQDILGQYSMLNLELFNMVDELKKVSKAFVVHPKNVNADNATILPVMLSSKLLPEMEADDDSLKDQLLQGMMHNNLPVGTQIDKLKARIDMIAAACEGAEKVLADTRKAYCFGARQGLLSSIAPTTLDKGQAAKIHEQENLLRAAVNGGDGLRIPSDQRHFTMIITPSLPSHLQDALVTPPPPAAAAPNANANANDAVHLQQPLPPADSSNNNNNNNIYITKNTPLSSNTMQAHNSLLQVLKL